MNDATPPDFFVYRKTGQQRQERRGKGVYTRKPVDEFKRLKSLAGGLGFESILNQISQINHMLQLTSARRMVRNRVRNLIGSSVRIQPNRRLAYQKLHVTRHGVGWKYARTVPLDLRALEGKTTWVKYLGRVDYNAALAVARKLDTSYEARAAALRKLSGKEKDQILRAWEQGTALSPVDAWLKNVEVDLRFEQVDRSVATLLNEISLDPDPYLPDEANYHHILEVLDLRKRATEDGANRRQRRSLAAKILGKEDYRLRTLIDFWRQKKTPRSAKTVEKAHLYVGRFVAVCGDLEPKIITRVHAVSFLSALEQRKFSPGTINLHLEKLHALFNVAIANDKFGVSINPFSGVRASNNNKLDVASKRPFSPAQVSSLIAAAGPTEFGLVTRILAYHGARSSEVCQLTVNDVCETYGVLVMRIHAKNGGVTGPAAIREVPVHPSCRDEILVQRDKVRSSAASHGAAPDGARWLFPETVCTRVGAVRGHDFQLKFGRWIRRIGIDDKSQSLHSLRHTFRDLCREAEMPEDISRAIMGHSLGRGDHGATYGQGTSLKKRLAWLSKIDPLTQ